MQSGCCASVLPSEVRRMTRMVCGRQGSSITWGTPQQRRCWHLRSRVTVRYTTLSRDQVMECGVQVML